MERVLVNIPSNPIFERIVRASADELGQAIGLPPERVEDLKLAVSEAVNNAIDHGNRRESAKLVEVIFALDADKLEVRIRDEGAGTDRIDFSRRTWMLVCTAASACTLSARWSMIMRLAHPNRELS